MAQRKKRVKPAPVITGGEAIAPPVVDNHSAGDGVQKVNGDVVMASPSAQGGQEEGSGSAAGEKIRPKVQESNGDDAMAVDSDHADDALVEDAI